MAKKKMLNTDEALLALNSTRGVAVAYSTFARWLREGNVPGAKRTETPRGPVWEIPASAIAKIELPKKGRPTTKKGEKK